jgi:hypothetical protein
MPPTPARKGPFPIQHAFVVQFAADTGLDAQGLAGRVEHVTSGQATRFVSREALMAFVTQVLQTSASQRATPRPTDDWHQEDR